MLPTDSVGCLGRRDFIGLAAVGATTALAAKPGTAFAASGMQWRPDGTNLPRLGLLVAAHDWNPEIEIAAMNDGQANIFASRMPIRFTREVLSDFTHADAAADLLTRLNAGAVLYTSTSTGYFLGPEREEAFKKRLEGRMGGIPIATAAMALVEALKTLNVRRIALVHPPWFGDEQHEVGRAYFQARGFDVVSALRVTPARTLSEVSAQEVYRWVLTNTPPKAEAVVQGGGGLRMIGAIDALEQALSRPVITANQAALWHGLGLAGGRARIVNYGRLFGSRSSTHRILPAA